MPTSRRKLSRELFETRSHSWREVGLGHELESQSPGRALGGLLVAYAYLRYLKGDGIHPIAEVKYRYLKWKINRSRKKFDVYSGGRTDDWNRKVH